jgi:hypothetical protein
MARDKKTSHEAKLQLQKHTQQITNMAKAVSGERTLHLLRACPTVIGWKLRASFGTIKKVPVIKVNARWECCRQCLAFSEVFHKVKSSSKFMG